MEFDQAFLPFVTQQIMADPREEETPVARLKQVGIMSVIANLHVDGSPITLARLIDITGLSRGGLVQIMDLLVQRGLLVETMGKNSMGRGTARQFDIAGAVHRNIALLGEFLGCPPECPCEA